MSYKLFRDMHRENIVLLLEEGNFYSAYMEDAYVLNYLFSFKIIYSNHYVKVSFPRKSLNRVRNILELRKCTYCIPSCNLVTTKCSGGNNYLKYLNQENYLKDRILEKLKSLTYQELLSVLQDSFKL